MSRFSFFTLFLFSLMLFLSCGHSVKQENSDDIGSPVSIDTTIDPAYVYTYEKTKFVPPSGKILYIAGQEKRDIPNFLNASKIMPAGLSSYWGISSSEGITTDSVDQGAGIQNINWLVTTYPNTVMQSALWIVGKWSICEKTLKGDYNATIDAYITWAKSVKVPIYLRIGYEFDGIHNELEPDKYVAVYKYIVDRMRAAGVDNVAFVWHSYASPTYKNYDLMAWYPGDDYVDWFAVSIFGHAFNSDLGIWMDKVVDKAREHKKPVMVAESTPAGGIQPDSYATWNTWFVNYFNYIYKKNIRAFSIISCDWDACPMFAHQKWGDTRIQQFPLILETWNLEVSKPQYLKSSTTLFSDLGYVVTSPSP